MTDIRHELIREWRDIVDGTKVSAQQLAAQFANDSPREDVMRLHRRMRRGEGRLTEIMQISGMVEYTPTEVVGTIADVVAFNAAINAKMDEIADFIEVNFPTYGTSLNSAMTAVGMTQQQQDTLRNQIGGATLNYLLVLRFSGNQLISPTLPAAQLTSLVTLLNELVTLATVPPA